MLITLVIYFALLMAISRLVGRDSNDAFFRGNRKSPWPVVAFGMIGASISGVTFVSVTGMVIASDMTYLQMCMGFIIGYLLVAFLLVPMYYRHNLTSIYTYLRERFGTHSHKTGAAFFLLSKLTGAAARMYIVCLILQQFIFSKWHVPFPVTVLCTLTLIWLYTRKSGIRTIVWTDTLQTLCLLTALVLLIINATTQLNLDTTEALSAVCNNPHSRIFEFSDWASPQHFWKQFLSGVFIVIVMTGLDQDMMQKNLTCKDKRSAQKDLCTYGMMFLPVNFLFLSLGVLLIMLYTQTATPLPSNGDQLLPDLIASGTMGETALILFALGIISSSFSSADSAITSLTTSYCIDILGISPDDQGEDSKANIRRRKTVHIVMTLLLAILIIAIHALGSNSIIHLIYLMASYTYGPLLGLFAFGIFTRRTPVDRHTPLIAVACPLACAIADITAEHYFGYTFGYELLMLNGMLTFALLYASSLKSSKCFQ